MSNFKRLSITSLVVQGSNGCDWWRTLIPFYELNRLGYNATVARYGEALPGHPDVLVCPRTGFRSVEQADEFISLSHSEGCIIVVDQDDANLDIPHTNPHWQGEKLETMGRIAMERADLITITTERLASYFRPMNQHVVVLPNLVDPKVWRMPPGVNWRVDKRLTVGVHGGDGHGRDWLILPDLFRRLAARYAELRLFVGGDRPAWFDDLQDELGERLVNVGWSDVEHYPYTVGQIDIGLCPLEATEFNECKSPIKWMESAMLGRPVVASETLYRRYIDDGRTGLIAGPELYQWFNAICQLVDDKTLRQNIGLQAHFQVLKKWNVHDPAWVSKRINAYGQAWERVMGRKFDGRITSASRGQAADAVRPTAGGISNAYGRAVRSRRVADEAGNNPDGSSRFPAPVALGPGRG